jgi:DNA-binding CsgD family transcriptional regulator
VELEKSLLLNKQFFILVDLIQLKIKFTSSGSKELFGIDPERVDPSTFYTRTHPDILLRHNIARTKLLNLGQELFITKQPYSLLSTNLKFRNSSEEYSDFLVQCYLFYSEIPYKTVFLLQVVTDIEMMSTIKYGYHFYLGSDMSFFCYPDARLLNTGNVFSKREFEIVSLLAEGRNSHQIADKLFLSVHTVNTHRRNLLKKSGKTSTNELILSLKERGVI